MSLSRSGAARLPVATNIVLLVLKLGAAMVTGSIAIMAEALHSLIDLMVALVTFYSVRASRKPADDQHPFGHGEIESVAGTAQAIAIAGTAGFLIYRAVTAIIDGASLQFTEMGISVVALSAVANALVSMTVRRAARATNSVPLAANARHLQRDLRTSVVVVVGLIAIRIWGLGILDPLLAIGVSLYMCWTAWAISRRSVGGLVDESLPVGEQQAIETCIMQHTGDLVSYHDLRTRRSGRQRYVDLHLVMQRDVSVEKAHHMCDHLESDIAALLPRTSVVIHCEPCHTEECTTCTVACSQRQMAPHRKS